LLLVLILFPVFAARPYLIHLLIMTYIGIILGMCFSMIFSTGMISLGIAAFYGTGAYASAKFTMDLGISFWFALPLATITSGVIALALGSVIVRRAGVSFVVISFIFNLLVVQATGQLRAFGGWGGILDIPRPDPIVVPFFGIVDFVTKTPYYYLMLLIMLLIMLVFHAMYTSRIGRTWKAIKLNPTLAQTLGINLYRYRLLAFIIASMASGATGSFYAHYFQSIIPDAFGHWTSVYIQLYSVLGGLDFHILGPSIGAAIMIFLPEFIRELKEVEPLITGALLVMIVVFFPGGILGTIKGFRLSRSLGFSGWLAGVKRLIFIGRSLD
jgi:branched-chain amino acid transport system permease protein